jgi:hypothetical protein
MPDQTGGDQPRNRDQACSTVNPCSLSKSSNSSGIGFSLVWLNDKDGKLWMCDAAATATS